MQKGFTLIEFMIILVIITILAVIAIPAFIKYSNRQQEAQGKSQLLNQPEVARLQQRTAAHKIPFNNLVFFQDERSRLCFAYAWVGTFHGGPAMTEVNCEAVEGWLINPSPNKDNAAAKPACPPDCPKQ